MWPSACGRPGLGGGSQDAMLLPHPSSGVSLTRAPDCLRPVLESQLQHNRGAGPRPLGRHLGMGWGVGVGSLLPPFAFRETEAGKVTA